MKRFIENRPSSDTARRPLPPLAGNLLFLGALFAMSLLVMAIEKPLFLLWYHAQAAEASAAELALVVWNGLKLDQTVAGYITALPLLVVLAALWIPGPMERSVLKGYLLVIAAVAATAFAANLALYEYWAFPLDSSVLQYLASPKEALASVTAGQLLLQLLVAAAVFGGMAWCYLRVLRLYDPARRSTHRAGSTLVLLLAAGVLFLPIRGGVSVATANVSKVYFSGRMFLNHAAVNPLFSFLSTLSDGDDALYEYEFFPEPERAAIFEPLRGDLPAGIETDTLLCTRRPNIVLFLVESFGRYDARRACRRRTRSSRIPTVEGRGSLFRQPLRQLVPHRPRHGSRAERISRPDQDVGHEAARQEPAAPLDRPLAAPRGLCHELLLRRRPQLHQHGLLPLRHGLRPAHVAERPAFRRPDLEMGLCRTMW